MKEKQERTWGIKTLPEVEFSLSTKLIQVARRNLISIKARRKTENSLAESWVGCNGWVMPASCKWEDKTSWLKKSKKWRMFRASRLTLKPCTETKWLKKLKAKSMYPLNRKSQPKRNRKRKLLSPEGEVWPWIQSASSQLLQSQSGGD